MGIDEFSTEIFFSKLSVIGWDEFVRQISVLVLFNRSNYDLKQNQTRRGSLSYPQPKNNIVISHVNVPSNSINNLTIASELSTDELFRKHGHILQKLNRRQQQEEINRKKMGSIVDWSIVESVDEEENLELPRLKPNARDERQTVSEPWSVVREMQQLRNEPLPIITTRYQMVKV